MIMNTDESAVEVISLHIPKTAGTAFRKVLQQVYGNTGIILDYPGEYRKFFQSEWTTRKAQIKAIHGHFPLNKYEKYFPHARTIIWLRNPIERLISHYFFWKNIPKTNVQAGIHNVLLEKRLSLLEFAQLEEMQNHTLKFCPGKKADDFDFVGLQEFFLEDLKILQNILIWPDFNVDYINKNPDPHYTKLLQEILGDHYLIKKLEDINHEEILFYQESINARNKRLFLTEKKLQLNDNFLSISNSQIIDSKGNIDQLVFNKNDLIIKGWVACQNDTKLEDFVITIGTINNKINNWFLLKDIPSFDVKNKYPFLTNADLARFRIKIPNTSLKSVWEDQLIFLTPLFTDGVGNTLIQVIEPSLEIPDNQSIDWVGGGGSVSFLKITYQFLSIFIQKLGLQPTNSLLDIGCGVGRIAYGLSYYLNSQGKYEGFDPVPQLIKWAEEKIGTKHSNFRFHQFDLHNKLYHSSGVIDPTKFIFPYDQNSFDFVCAISVFNHLPTDEVRHYLQEIERVLKPGGRCLLTLFLINEESEELIKQCKSTQNLVIQIDHGLTNNDEIPEEAIGLYENDFMQWIKNLNLTVVEKIYGWWCGRQKLYCEDIIILQKS